MAFLLNTLSTQATHRSSYWFDDGSLVVRAEDTLYRLHGSFLGRHSPAISMILKSAGPVGNTIDSGEDILQCSYLCILSPSQDFEALLSHLYHDELLSSKTPLNKVSAVIRITGSDLLNFPALHELGIQYLQDIIPADISSRHLPYSPQLLEEVLDVATDFRIHSVKKPLFYALMTNSNFHSEDGEPSDVVSPHYAAQCQRLMALVIAHFTPILFTPPATSHMACTDVFADTWMTHVIQPALGNDGVYKPLETLEQLKEIHWEAEGICSACFQDKKTEWSGEQNDIWKLMDSWLDIPSK